MPLVLFTPEFGFGHMVLALLLPLLVHVVVGNLLEPVFFGRSMELHPVMVLLSLMVWGTLWGVPGLVLAVPLTAVLKIHLSHIDHPLPRLLLRLLEGTERHEQRRQQQQAAHHRNGAETSYDEELLESNLKLPRFSRDMSGGGGHVHSNSLLDTEQGYSEEHQLLGGRP